MALKNDRETLALCGVIAYRKCIQPIPSDDFFSFALAHSRAGANRQATLSPAHVLCARPKYITHSYMYAHVRVSARLCVCACHLEIICLQMISSDETDIPQLEYINTHAASSPYTATNCAAKHASSNTTRCPAYAVRGIAIDLRVDGVCAFHSPSRRIP